MSTMTRITPNSVPAAYAALGATVEFKPPPAIAYRWLLASEGGCGKTTFAASFPDSILLDLERGSHSIVGGRAVRIPCGRSLSRIQRVLEQLYSDSKKAAGDPALLPFKVVIIDSIDAYSDLIADYLCEKATNERKKEISYIGDYDAGGGGWARVRNLVVRTLHDLDEAGYAWVAIVHKSEKKDPDGRIYIRPTLFDSLYSTIKYEADIEANVVVSVVRDRIEEARATADGRTFKVSREGPPRHVYTLQIAQDERRLAKHRIDLRGDIVLPLIGGWDVFKERYDQAIEDLRKQDAALMASTA